jgi:hypothetical protein
MNAFLQWFRRPVPAAAPHIPPRCKADWNAFFSALDPPARTAGALRVCRELISRTGLQSPAVDAALPLIAQGAYDAEVLSQVEALVEQCGSTYEALVGSDERKLLHEDPDVRDAYRREMAAWAVLFALRGDYSEVALQGEMVMDVGEVMPLLMPGAAQRP